LATCNHFFAQTAHLLIELKSKFPEHPVQFLRLDNTPEFKSDLFTRFCTMLGITLEYIVPYIHQSNGLAESHIKRLQAITHVLLLHANLPATAWGFAFLHATNILNYHPVSFKHKSAHEIYHGTPPLIDHLRTWGC
jgi:hypothetical protein